MESVEKSKRVWRIGSLECNTIKHFKHIKDEGECAIGF